MSTQNTPFGKMKKQQTTKKYSPNIHLTKNFYTEYPKALVTQFFERQF